MKEAQGELNSTLLVVLAVAALAAFFFSTLWPMIRTNYESNAKCSDAVCGYDCSNEKTTPSNGKIGCCYRKDKGDRGTDMMCPYKG